MLYGDWIGRWGRSYPDKEALVDTIANRRYTYGQLAAEINRMANFLAGTLGVAKGDRVAILALNRADYIVLFFAASRLGAILVPLNFRLVAAELAYFLDDARPKVFFFDKAHEHVAKGIEGTHKIASYVGLDDSGSADYCLPADWDQLSPAPPPRIEIAADDPQLIIYTSGTTGLPKGVILTHGMITWNCINTVAGWDLGAGDRTVLHPALFYTGGWNVFTLPLFYCRATNILVPRFDADQVLKLIEQERLTLFFGVPTMFQMLMDSPLFDQTDFSRVHFMVSGGAPLPHAIREAFQQQKEITIREGYGLTEAGPNNFMANGKPGTVGNHMPHVDIKIVDGAGNRLPDGKDGELYLRGPHVCAGYWNKPEASAEAIQDGWFLTGDLARVDDDGHLAIVGRKKDMFISGGVNIYPAEIERILAKHPSVNEAAVIGVPDEKWGEVGKAIYELKTEKSLSLEELKQFLASRVAKFKIPKYFVSTDELPRTIASGKVQKFRLKEMHGKPDNRL